MGIRKLFGKKKQPAGSEQQAQRITLNDLSVSFHHLERDILLEDWTWRIGPTKLPIALTAVGDAFIQDVDDGTVHFLDTGAGTLQQVAASADEFQSLLANRGFVFEFFRVELFSAVRASGSVLGPGQLYGFKIPPVLGGKHEPSNMEPTAIEVHFSLWGAAHQQLAELPPGTKIEGFRFEPPQ